MTDQQSASSVNLFRPSASPLTPVSNGVDAGNTGTAPGGVFSQELSRASQRTASSSEPSKSRQEAPRDSVQSSDKRSSESSRSTDSTETSQRSEERQATPADHSGGRTDSTDSTAQQGDVTEKGGEQRASSETLSDAESDSGSAVSPESGANQSEAQPVLHAESSEIRKTIVEGAQAEGREDDANGLVSGEKVVNSTVVAAIDGTIDTQGEESLLPVSEHLTADAPAQVDTDALLSEPVSAAQSELESVGDKPASVIPVSGTSAPSGNGATVTAESVALDTREKATEVTSKAGVVSAQGVTAGEQMSSAELASRQGAVLSTQGNRDRQGVGTVTPAIDPEQSALEIPSSSTTRVVNATNTVPTLQDRGITADPTMSDEFVVSQVIPSVEKEGLQAPTARQVVQADLQLQTNMQEKLIARKIEQQNTAANLMQVKKLAQQQAQNTALAAVAADNSSQGPDNTFLSLHSGIVTAPVLQRTDPSSTQVINAPVNIPILQQDSDKAMASNIRWMVNEGVKSAVVNVTPSGMGPISVSIGVENEQMNVSIVALQGSTREALDSMLPRLREQLTAQGHDSVKVDISDGRSEQSDRGYGQQFSGEQRDSGSSSSSARTHSETNETGNNAHGAEKAVSLPEQQLLTLHNSGQIKSSYDIYV